jgi:BASS family bile acid:Na+ symporter
MLYVIRRPGLLARSLTAMFVRMPAVAIALARFFDFKRVVEIALIALSISPVPPLLPQREGQAGGRRPYALGLMALLALLSIALVPAVLQVLNHLAHRRLDLGPFAVAKAVFTTALAPLAGGMIVQRLLPDIVRLRRAVNRVAWVLLLVGIGFLLAASFPAIRALVGNGTLLAMTAFITAALAIGHVLGGPDPDHSVVLALSNACRHPSIAIAIGSANFPDQQFGATVLLYAIMNASLCIPYVVWQRRRIRSSGGTRTPLRHRRLTES